MIIQAENITWSRFNNFLMFNTILVLAWSTIYVADPALHQSRTWPLVALCFLGALSGVAWAFLGCRGRAYLEMYLKVAAVYENDKDVWANELKKEQYKLVNRTLVLSKRLNNKCIGLKWASPTVLLIGGPLAFFFLYLFLCFVLLKC